MRRRRRTAAVDFTENMMPQTRKAVFQDVLKLHWFDLLKLGALLLAAFLPILTMTVVDGAYEASLLAELGEEATQEALRAAYVQIASFQNTSAIINILFYMLFGVVFAGALRVIRQYAWEEVVFFWRDLGTGIRQNGKQIVLLACIMGVQNAIGMYLSNSGQFAQDTVAGAVGVIFNGLSVLVFLPVWAYMCILICVYSNTFLQNMQLAFALYAKSLGKTLLILLGLGAVWLISGLPYFLCRLIGQVLGILLLPIGLLVWCLFVCAQLDKYVNPQHFPELVGRGLYQAESVSEEQASADVEINNNEKEDLC